MRFFVYTRDCVSLPPPEIRVSYGVGDEVDSIGTMVGYDANLRPTPSSPHPRPLTVIALPSVSLDVLLAVFRNPDIIDGRIGVVSPPIDPVSPPRLVKSTGPYMTVMSGSIDSKVASKIRLEYSLGFRGGRTRFRRGWYRGDNASEFR